VSHLFQPGADPGRCAHRGISLVCDRVRGHRIHRLHVTDAVRMLDALTGADPERDHGQADEILLASVPAEVREAYLRLTGRASWWAAA
jgi:hypothetical protein